jgi:hypothetical protein
MIVKKLEECNLKEVLNIQLKKSDMDELALLKYYNSKDAILQSINCSELNNVIFNKRNEVVGIFGLSIDNDKNGIPWLLTTNGIDEIWFEISRYSKKIINNEYLKLSNNKLYNIVSKENKKSIKYLEFIGFKLTEFKENKNFLYFEIKKKKEN